MAATPALRTIPQIVPFLTADESASVLQTLEDGWITEGPRSAAFVEALKQTIQVPYGVLAPNGTLALALGLMALGIGPGDEVIIPDITFIGSANAVLMVGATPVLVDVEPDTFQIDPTQLEHCLTYKTRAIMPVHLYGTACDMDPILALARRHGLLVIEDAAQGIGVCYKGKPVGGLGDVGCFSFFADKTITTGEGGFVACRDEHTYRQLLLLRNQGRLNRGSFVHPAIGYNFRMTDMQAAVGLAQIKKLDWIIQRKQELWATYVSGLQDVRQVRILGAASHSTHVPFRCVLMAQEATQLQAHLEQAGVQIRSFFYPLHRQPCFGVSASEISPVRSFGNNAYPVGDSGFSQGLCLPIYPTLTDDDVHYIVDLIVAFYS